MFAAYLEDEAVWRPFLVDPVLRQSMKWLATMAATAATGDHPLGAPGWYANVHGYTTAPEAGCLWENHPRTVDVQYLVSGGEGVRWAPARQLGPPLCYREEKDRQEFAAPQRPASLLALRAGMFALFLPGEAHCPKIAVGGSEMVRKVVVKVPARLLAGGGAVERTP